MLFRKVFEFVDRRLIGQWNRKLFGTQEDVAALVLVKQPLPLTPLPFAQRSRKFFGFGATLLWVLVMDAQLCQFSLIAAQPFLDVCLCRFVCPCVNDQPGRLTRWIGWRHR